MHFDIKTLIKSRQQEIQINFEIKIITRASAISKNLTIFTILINLMYFLKCLFLLCVQ